jgi:hypothetical protein
MILRTYSTGDPRASEYVDLREEEKKEKQKQNEERAARHEEHQAYLRGKRVEAHREGGNIKLDYLRGKRVETHREAGNLKRINIILASYYNISTTL